jgi:hypothetical protein
MKEKIVVQKRELQLRKYEHRIRATNLERELAQEKVKLLQCRLRNLINDNGSRGEERQELNSAPEKVEKKNGESRSIVDSKTNDIPTTVTKQFESLSVPTKDETPELISVG